MKNSTLIGLLQQLDTEEFKRFGDFLESPFHNSNKNCLALYQQLKRFYPNFEAKNLDKDKIGIKIFGSQEKANRNMPFLMSSLNNLVCDFLTQLQLEANKDIRDTFLLKGLSEKGLKRYFVTKYKSIMEELEQQTIQSSISYFGNKYEKLTLLQEFNELYKDESLPIELQHIADIFYKHSILQQLHIATIIVNKASVKSVVYDHQQVEILLETVESKKFLSETLIELYYHVLKLLVNNLNNTADVSQDFLLLKQSLSKATQKVADNELHNFYAFAHAYCNKQVQKGKEHFRREALELYKQQLAQNVLEINGYIVPNNVFNIVTLGLQCGETVWVREFIEIAHNKVAPKFAKNLYVFNLAKYYFYTKNFQHCLEQLHEVDNFIDVIYQIEAKSLLLRVYYELNEYLAFDALVASFKEYVKHQASIPKQRKESYLNFIAFANKLYKYRLSNSKTIDDIKANITDCANISDRSWLLEKIGELVGSTTPN